jgi:hypothetical protein
MLKGIKVARLWFVSLAVLLMTFAFVSAAYPQLAGANLSGYVRDDSGGVVPNARISVRNNATNNTREAQSNADGLYSVPNLSPGDYEVTVAATGFTILVESGVSLTVGSEQTLNLTLKVGEVSDRIVVTSTLPTVETSSSTLGATVEQRTITELPLNGRDWTQMATLQPGVTAVRAQASTASNNTSRGNRGFGNQLSDSGHRPSENTYRVDGISINDYTNNAPGGVLGVTLGVDAIREFNVVTTNYTAEYGRTSGAVINSVTKSGTNGLHGSAFFLDRDRIFDAKNFFETQSTPFHRGQFGGSAGDALVKGKLFIFGNYEGLREAETATGIVVVPSRAARNGTSVDGPVDAKIQPFLALWPLADPSTEIGQSDRGITSVGTLKIVHEDFFTLRADQTISAKDTLSETYFYDSAPQTLPDSLNNVRNLTGIDRRMFGITENHIFSPSLINIVRVGFNRTKGLVSQPDSAINPVAADKTLGIFPGVTTASLINIGGGITSAFGLGGGLGFRHVSNSFQAYDDVFVIHGNHSLKFGFAFERLQANEISSLRINGQMQYPSLADFLHNTPAFALFYDPRTRKEMGVRDTLLAGYIQDDWRVRSNLTLNIGLRYEALTNPTEVHGTFQTLTDLYTGVPQVGGDYWRSNPTFRNFDPRVGFSWDPLHDGKTAVRAAFGIFDVLPLPSLYASESVLSPPFATELTGSGAAIAHAFPDQLVNSVQFSQQNTRYVYTDPKPKRSYAMNWNFNIERDFSTHLSAQIGYVGSHVVHQAFTADDNNQVLPTTVGGVLVWPGPTSCNGGPCPVANQNVGAIYSIFLDNSAKYNGLQTQFRVRDFHGLQEQTTYTWSKCLDGGSGGGISDPFLNSLSTLMYFNKAARKGPCDFDLRHNLSVNFIYELPSLKNHPSLMWVTGGWQLGGVVTGSSGIPFTLFQGGNPGGGDPLGEGNTDPYDFPSRVAGCNPIVSNFKSNGMNYINPDCFTYPTVSVTSPIAPLCNTNGVPDQNGQRLCLNIFGNAGRNQLVGPRLVDVDFSVIKNTRIPRISDSFNLQLRFEFFNILNHANFQAPVDNLQFNGLLAGSFNSVDNGGSTGLITQTSTTPRQIQLGLKIIW